MKLNIELYRVKDFYQIEEFYDKENNNHILVDVREKSATNSFLGQEKIKKKLLHISGDVDLFLSCFKRDDDKNMDNLKNIINVLSINSNVRNVNIKLVTADYEYYRARVQALIYAMPVSYLSRTPERLILRTKGLKFLGLNIGRKVIGIFLLIKRIKRILVR